MTSPNARMHDPLLITVAVGVITCVIGLLVYGWVKGNMGSLGDEAIAGVRFAAPWLIGIGLVVATVSCGFVGFCLWGTWPAAGGADMRERTPFRVVRGWLVPHSLKFTDLDEALAEITGMVGISSVKEEINRLLARIEMDRRRDLARRHLTQRRSQESARTESATAPMCLHMIFTGPVGVGKTLVASTLGPIFVATGKLVSGHLVEANRASLVAPYAEQTTLKTLGVCQRALDGVLFIDKIHEFISKDQRDIFGREAINTVLKFMGDHDGRIAVVVAGSESGMRRVLESIPELTDRFPRWIRFPRPSRDDLLLIFEKKATSLKLLLPEQWTKLVGSWVAEMYDREDWGNARAMHNLLERVREAQAERLAADQTAHMDQITREDLILAIERTW